MKLLALESSAKTASAAVWGDEGLLGLQIMNCGLTHSETLLPMAERLLQGCGLTVSALDLIAVARGPGSFTGIRIGVAAAKGLSWGAEKPLCGVSTLEAMAWQGSAYEGRLLCCTMDARRNQVYNALFRMEDGVPRRVSGDRAIALAELLPELTEKPVLFGDGSLLTAKALEAAGMPYTLAPEPIRLQNGCGVALAALHAPESDRGDTEPVYLRLSQAERERLERLNGQSASRG